MSGGELQRMAIARAMLMYPKILLLDEATSSVDSETESQIQASLKKLCAGRTTFVIAHRLSTIIDADVVVVINNGQIVEQGTHADLLKTKGHYHKLWARQLKQQKGKDKPRSRSRSPAKKEAPVLVNDVSSGDDNAMLLEQAVVEPDDHESGSELGRTHHESAHATGHKSQEADSSIDGEMKKRGRSPAKALTGSLAGRVAEQSPQRPKSPPAVPTKSVLRGLNVDAPEFVPTIPQTNGISTPVDGDKVHKELEISKSFSTSALATIPEEKSKELLTRRNSIPITLEREFQDAGAKITNGKTIPADRVPPRRMGILSPRRKHTQSEPFVEMDCRQVDGAEEENEVGPGGDSTSKNADVRKRTVSAPLGTTGGPEAVATDGSQAHGRTSSNDSNTETEEGLASPRIKAPTNTPARAISEETSPKTKV
jgi:ABC transporter